MAVNLIRKNNGVGITAYQDSVMFHLAKGENGVIPDVHDEFEASYDGTSKILRVESGMGIAYGRQFEIVPGEEIQFDFSSLSGTRYIVIYVEIDLRDPTNEVALLKSTYATTAYPVIDVGDNLIDAPSGVYRMVLYHVLKTSESATIETMFTKLQNDKIKYAGLSDDAKLVNGIDISYNETISEIETIVPEGVAEVIERKQLIFSSDVGQLLDYQNTGLTTLVPLNDGDFLEVVYAIDYTYKIKKFIRRKIKATGTGIGNASLYINESYMNVHESSTASRHTYSLGVNIEGSTWTYYESSSLTEHISTSGTITVNSLLLDRGVVNTTTRPTGVRIYKIYKIGGAL